VSGGICDGRVCIVTGAGRGLGRAYVRHLARHGAKVVVNDLGVDREGRGADRSPALAVVDEIVGEGGEAVASDVDVSSWEGARALVDTAVRAFGRLDVLVNNAGILRDRMVVSMTESDWDDVIRVHLRGTFASSRHACAYWRQQVKDGRTNDARIVNTTSASGLYANVGQANYAAAKAGIAAFTQVLAQEGQRYGVTANAIAPGAVTRLTDGLEMSDDRRLALGPERVAPLVTWLASPRSAGVTGEVFECSGRVLTVAEGWRRGPAIEDVPADLDEIDAQVRTLISRRRARTTMGDVASASNVGSQRSSGGSAPAAVR
jgi:NAD(P)-dependent dehydrogenase (short-subunit alcohol dehydrogenase family)